MAQAVFLTVWGAICQMRLGTLFLSPSLKALLGYSEDELSNSSDAVSYTHLTLPTKRIV